MVGMQHRFSAEDRRQQILEIATDLFANQGYEGTTTREIANKAGVNEAIIFRHFPCKVDLYWAVIDDQCRAAKKSDFLKEHLRFDQEPHKLFAALALGLLQRREKEPKLSRLLFFTALENHELSHRFFRTYVAEYYELLADYIRQQIDRGVFRPIDPLLAARSFLGMVVYHGLVQNLFGGSSLHPFENRRVAEAISSIWLDGVVPRHRVKHEVAPIRKRGSAARRPRSRQVGQDQISDVN